jgi:hypothetical protein
LLWGRRLGVLLCRGRLRVLLWGGRLTGLLRLVLLAGKVNDGPDDAADHREPDHEAEQ